MKYKAIFFDLDGTLTNPEKGILNCIQYACDYYGVKAEWDSLKKYIGPPLKDTFTELLGADKADEATSKYRERFAPVGLYENEIYDNVPNALEKLKNAGFVLCTASSKPQEFVEKILDHFDILKYFDYVGGATMDGKISEKDDVIKSVLDKTGLENNEVLMVGDRKYDLLGAEKMNMDAVGVLYGFGDFNELSACKNVCLINDITELCDILITK